MGNSISGHAESNIFEKELVKLNQIVNDIVNDKDIFKNESYNFLSQDVCQSYHVVIEDELSKYLKLDIKDLGASLYILPKNEDDDTKLTKLKLTKKQVCEKISNHYIKVLYVMCLIKYVYNLEKHGDLSISGIIFRNIKIIDDMMEIHFCALPHKKYTNVGKDAYKIDFSKLEGMKFFADYFLSPEESYTFLGILRAVLARGSAQLVQQRMCHYISKHGVADMKKLESMYQHRFPQRKLTCQRAGANLSLFIQKDNPIFLSDYCGAPVKLVVKLNTPQGKKILAYYKQMLDNYNSNVSHVQSLLSNLVHKSHSQYELKDITKPELDKVIDSVKWHVKQFYIQSIFDFQNLLDMAKETPNIHIV